MHRRLLRTALTATIAATLALVGLGQGSAAADTPLPPPPPHVGDYNGLAKTPPMGFNDWAGVRLRHQPAAVHNTADRLVSLGLNKLGYDYVNIDDCWMRKTRDANGNLQVNTDLFPNGLKWLGDYLHNKGLKFGIYEDAGYQTCQGAAGSYGNFQTDADQYASWGVDYLKLDYCYQPMDKYPGKTPGQVAQIVYHDASQALLNTKRPMIFSESAPAYYCCSGADFNNIMSWIYAEREPLALRQRHRRQLGERAGELRGGQHSRPRRLRRPGPLERRGHAGDRQRRPESDRGTEPVDVWSETRVADAAVHRPVSKLTPAELNVIKDKDVVAVDQDQARRAGHGRPVRHRLRRAVQAVGGRRPRRSCCSTRATPRRPSPPPPRPSASTGRGF